MYATRVAPFECSCAVAIGVHLPFNDERRRDSARPIGRPLLLHSCPIGAASYPAPTPQAHACLVYRLFVTVAQALDPDSPSSLPRAEIDPASKSWLSGLHATGGEHDECVARLHALLLRVAHYEVSRRATSLRLVGPELDDIAHQACDDALMAIKGKFGDFRGESRFTTWAYRFVMFEVSTKIGRHFWRHRPDALDDDAWDRIPDTFAASPGERAEDRELLAALRRAIDEDLTYLQRRVFVAIALNEVPMDAFARELGSNRNAVYKTLFDARRKLRTSLATAGYARPDPARSSA